MLPDVIQTSEMEARQTVSSAASASDATPEAKAQSQEVHEFLAPVPLRNMSGTKDDAERTEQIETVSQGLTIAAQFSPNILK